MLANGPPNNCFIIPAQKMFELLKFERDLDATSHVYVSLTILKNNYHKSVHRAQLKKSSFKSLSTEGLE